MAVQYLKSGKPAGERAEDDAKVRSIVSEALRDIEARGDAAVRDLATRFDGYTPASFRLSLDQIEALIAQVSPRDLDDIRFAQAQVRKFAQAQRASMQDIEVETLPGVILGHRNIPVQSVGCYVPRRQIPDGRQRAYVGADRRGRRRAAHHRQRPAGQRCAEPRHRRRDAHGRRA
jgi:sulfopropanediol 3-dehydrogenase